MQVVINKLTNLIILFVVIITLSSCVMIKTFDSFWQEAKVDTNLIGQWVETNHNLHKTLVKQNDYLVNLDMKTGKIEQDTKIKSLFIDDYKFLLIQSKDVRLLSYYTIKDDTLIIYTLDRAHLDKFDKYSKNLTGTSLQANGIAITSLDQATIDQLILSIKDELWNPIATFSKGISQSIAF